MMMTASSSEASKIAALNTRLPDHLRLDNSPGLEAELDRLAGAGWTPDGLAAHIGRKAGPNSGPGLVVSLIRSIDGKPQRAGTIATVGLIIDAHPFTQHPDLIGGWSRCGLPRANRHHTGDN